MQQAYGLHPAFSLAWEKIKKKYVRLLTITYKSNSTITGFLTQNKRLLNFYFFLSLKQIYNRYFAKFLIVDTDKKFRREAHYLAT